MAVLPLHAGTQHQDDTRRRGPIRSAQPYTVRLLRFARQQHDHRPAVVGNESVHALPTRSNRLPQTPRRSRVQRAAAMRDVVASREKAAQKGMRAAQLVRNNFSIPAISHHYKSRLDEIRTSRELQ